MALVSTFVNGVLLRHVKSKVTRESERGVDVAEITYPANVTLNQNDEIQWLLDTIDLTGLIWVSHFEGTCQDESGYKRHGTPTNSPTYVVGQYSNSKAIHFVQASAQYVRILDNNAFHYGTSQDFAFRCKFKKSNDGFTALFYHKGRNTAGGICVDFYVDAASGRVLARAIDGTHTAAVASPVSPRYDDGQYHDAIASYTRTGNLVLFVDGAQVASVSMTTVGNLTTTDDALIGAQMTSSSTPNTFGNWDLEEFRIYNRALTATDVNILYTNPNSRHTVWFYGYSWKVEKNISTINIQCQSIGKILSQTQVIAKAYSNQTIDAIVADLIANNAPSLTYISSSVSTGITLGTYTADGALIDLLTDLAQMSGFTFRTEGLGIFRFEPFSYQTSNITFTHGEGCIVEQRKSDDTGLVNDYCVLGENARYNTLQLWVANGTATSFQLNQIPVAMRILFNNTGADKIPEVDYTIDIPSRTVTFASPPPSATTVYFYYEYEAPIYVRANNADSIAANGVHAKQDVASWLKTYKDAVVYVNAYLNAYKDPIPSIKITSAKLEVSFDDNDLLDVVTSTIPNVNGRYVMKSESWSYPDGKTEILLGMFNKNAYELHKDILSKLHDLQSALTTNKDLRGFVVVNENFDLNDGYSAV